MYKKSLEDKERDATLRFLRNINKTTTCWEWVGLLGKDGYGILYYPGGTKAHRFSYLYHFGDFDQSLHVCHKCDHSKCVNPNHLFLGTHQDNMKDMFAKGRGPKHGEEAWDSKLTNAQAVEIRRLYSIGNVYMKDLAKQYHVGFRCVNSIIRGRSYKNAK